MGSFVAPIERTKSIYYGWWVLIGMTLVYGATNGILINTLPLIYPDLSAEFGWNQDEVTRPATFFFVIGALTSPLAGYCLDRWSPRYLILCGVLGISAGLAMFPLISALWHLIAIYILFAVSLSFGGLVASMVVVTKWFDHYRGVAVGILLMSSSIGGALFPILIRSSLIESGWREAVMILAVTGALMMIIPILLVVRDRPEAMGLKIDGRDIVADKKAETAPTRPQADATLAAAIRSPDFYLLAFVTAVLWFSIIGTSQHQGIYFRQDVGLDTASVPLIFSTFFAASLIGKFLFGFLSDHFDRHLIMLVAVGTIVAGLSLLLASAAGGLPVAYMYAVVNGLGFAGVFTMIQILIADHYAGPSYGKILGLFAMIDTLGGGLGTQVLGRMRVAFDSYNPAIYLMIGLCLVSMVIVLGLRKRHAHSQGRAPATEPT